MSISNSEIQIIYMVISIIVIMFTFYGGYKYYKYRKNKPIPRGNPYYQKALTGINNISRPYNKKGIFEQGIVTFSNFRNEIIEKNGGRNITKEGYKQSLKDASEYLKALKSYSQKIESNKKRVAYTVEV